MRSSSSINRHSSASSAWRWAGMSAASDGWSTTRPHTTSAPAVIALQLRSIQSGAATASASVVKRMPSGRTRCSDESHGQPTRLPCIGVLHWEVMAFHIQSVGQRRRHGGDNRRRSITAIVGEYHHGVRATCLVSQREETRPDAFGLVLRRNRNNDEVLVHHTMRSARCFCRISVSIAGRACDDQPAAQYATL